MSKRIVEGIEVEASSGNVFADLGLPDADKLQIKPALPVEIAKTIRERGLTQIEAAKRMGLTQPIAQADGLPKPAGLRHRNSHARDGRASFLHTMC